MYCACYICGIQYRVKPPLDSDLVSHGLCGHCFPHEMRRIKEELHLLKEVSRRDSNFRHKDL